MEPTNRWMTPRRPINVPRAEALRRIMSSTNVSLDTEPPLASSNITLSQCGPPTKSGQANLVARLTQSDRLAYG